jgi:hypothetical protein
VLRQWSNLFDDQLVGEKTGDSMKYRKTKQAKPRLKNMHRMCRKLQEYFRHPFVICRLRNRWVIRWTLGPPREVALLFLINEHPELAAKLITKAISNQCGFEMYDGYVSFAFPFALQRKDLTNARPSEISGLVAMGADPNLLENGRSPLLDAIYQLDDEMAVALAMAGACIESCLPGGGNEGLARNLPGLNAVIEARILSGQDPTTETHARPPRRL